ncbi:hypothetical protein Daus18300_001042 [Diaporthe australafricana]|uniref:Uncharacterized protein n=1 Tax=Diaporthe australafricana TaxID=127596 RepID=A0ABR3XYV0_9PEZI
MTESQRQQINKKSTSKDATELQWFAVFDILFPGHHRRPSSPYIEFNLLQDLTLYQGFLETTGSRILSDCVMCQSAIARNLPEEKLDIAHAAFEHTTKEGLRDIFHQWMVPGSGDREEPNIPIEPGGESQLYLPNSCASTQRTDSYAKDPSGGASPNTALSLPEQGTSDTLAGSAALQTASSGQSVANKTSSGGLNFYYDSVDFTSGSTYEDNELVQLINESHSDLPSQSGLG